VVQAGARLPWAAGAEQRFCAARQTKIALNATPRRCNRCLQFPTRMIGRSVTILGSPHDWPLVRYLPGPFAKGSRRIGGTVNSLVLDHPVAMAELSNRLPLRAIVLWINAAALLAAAVFLRCWQLGNIPGFNGDEAWYGVQAMRAVHGQGFQWLTPTGNPINAFFFVLLVGLHFFLPPSVLLLRTVALAGGPGRERLAMPSDVWWTHGGRVDPVVGIVADQCRL
jgi:hypothetical protein